MQKHDSSQLKAAKIILRAGLTRTHNKHNYSDTRKRGSTGTKNDLGN